MSADETPSIEDSLLHIDGLSVEFGSLESPVKAVNDVTLDVRSGETLGIIGPSGSGKSSLLMLMGGLERATSGAVRALGRDLTAMIGRLCKVTASSDAPSLEPSVTIDNERYRTCAFPQLPQARSDAPPAQCSSWA